MNPHEKAVVLDDCADGSRAQDGDANGLDHDTTDETRDREVDEHFRRGLLLDHERTEDREMVAEHVSNVLGRHGE